ncbi:hypothetical protein PoB_000309600 [Plakobranchus ocellatus]|uniref:Uncharacterized protein n=1 Tax=Plakobranchus ocellatus TaxID=259542 RepID=A0AAV3Y0I2_9GAST|nr:hypothetical protein PoB_000309600 [Plakobranchus ocellatus]
MAEREKCSLGEHHLCPDWPADPNGVFPLSLARVFDRIFLTCSKASPQKGDLRLSGPPSGQGAGGRALTRDRRFPADLRAVSLAIVPPKFPTGKEEVSVPSDSNT